MTITAMEAANFSSFAYENDGFILPQVWKDMGWKELLDEDLDNSYHGKAKN